MFYFELNGICHLANKFTGHGTARNQDLVSLSLKYFIFFILLCSLYLFSSASSRHNSIVSASFCVACTGKHYVYLDDIAASVQLHRNKAQKLYMAPSLAFTPLQTSMQDYSSNFHTQVNMMFL